MTEILTESFCERCGTRYTFESGNKKRGRLGKVRTLSKGLRNYVLSDESSLSEAFADARSDDTQSVSADQLDAFHRTFNFCMSCRQYTCENCWNEPEGRCLSCAPHLGTEILPAAFPDLEPYAAEFPTNGHLEVVEPETNGHVADDLAWPEIDLPSARIARALGDEDLELPAPEAAELTEAPPTGLVGEAEAVPADPESGEFAAAIAAAQAIDAVADAEPWRIEGLVRPVEPESEVIEAVAEPVEAVADAEPVVEPDAIAAIAAVEAESPIEAAASPVEPEIADAEVEPDAPAIVPRIVPRSAASRSAAPDERAAAAAAQTNALLAKFRPGQSLDDAIAAYEAELAKARGVEPDDLDRPAELRAGAGEGPVEAVAAAPQAADREPVAADALAGAALVAELAESEAPIGEPEPVAEAIELEPAAAAVEVAPAVEAPEPVAAELEPVAVEPEPVSIAPEVAVAAAIAADAPETDRAEADGDHEAARIAAIAAAAAAAAAVGHGVADVASPGQATVEQPERAAAAALAAQPEPEPEPVAAEATPEPEPAKPAPQPQPVAAEAAPAPAAPKVDIVEQPAWRIVAPDAPGDAPTPWPVTPPPAPNGQPQYPQATADPQWPGAQPNGAPQWPSSPAPYVPSRTAQPAVGRIGGRTVVRGAEEIWAASNQEVLAKPAATGAAIAPCRSCGLSLSANARFCRRCGTRQG